MKLAIRLVRPYVAAALFAAALGAQEPPAPAKAAPTLAAPEVQIAAALQAAPEDRRAGATVLGYTALDPASVVSVLRQGTNDLVCLADDPRDDRFSVACYHESLEPFMRRGRELAAAESPARSG
ncbi:MAG: hypothetical protein R2862_08215 [Thermoanaerobaculia bacterium]